MLKDKTLNVMSTIAIIVLYIGAITNNDLIICVLANQLFIIILLLAICEKVDKENK